MCGRFSTYTIDDVRSILDEVQERMDAREGSWSIDPSFADAALDARPGKVIPVLTKSEDFLGPQELEWGYRVDWARGERIFNTRIEKAVGNDGMWPPIAADGRCLVIATRFWEPRKNTRKAAEFLPSSNDLFVMAGVFQEGRFSVVTTQPDAVIEPIHDRMPLCLTPYSAALWLSPAWRNVLFRETAPLLVAADPDYAEQLSLF